MQQHISFPTSKLPKYIQLTFKELKLKTLILQCWSKFILRSISLWFIMVRSNLGFLSCLVVLKSCYRVLSVVRGWDRLYFIRLLYTDRKQNIWSEVEQSVCISENITEMWSVTSLFVNIFFIKNISNIYIYIINTRGKGP